MINIGTLSRVLDDNWGTQIEGLDSRRVSNMDSDQIILYLKLLSVLAAGCLGLVGVLFDFRNKKGEISTAGKVILAGLAVATIVGLLSTIFEANRARHEAEKQLSTTTTVLREFSRTQSPITRVSLSYWVEFPENNREVQAFVRHIDEVVDKNKDSLLRFPPTMDGLDVSSFDLDDEPLSITIKPDSPYWPSKSTAIASVARSYKFSLYIYASPIDPTNFDPTISVSPGYSDFIANSYLINSNGPLYFDYKQKKLSVYVTQEIPSDSWKTNGNVRSLIDLYGSHIFLQPPNFSFAQLPERYAQFENKGKENLMNAMNIKAIRFSFADGHGMWINGNRFAKMDNVFGNPAFNLIVPSTPSEVESLSD